VRVVKVNYLTLNMLYNCPSLKHLSAYNVLLVTVNTVMTTMGRTIVLLLIIMLSTARIILSCNDISAVS